MHTLNGHDYGECGIGRFYVRLWVLLLLLGRNTRQCGDDSSPSITHKHIMLSTKRTWCKMLIIGDYSGFFFVSFGMCFVSDGKETREKKLMVEFSNWQRRISFSVPNSNPMGIASLADDLWLWVFLSDFSQTVHATNEERCIENDKIFLNRFTS